MRKIIYILLLFVTCSLYSQSITWQRIYNQNIDRTGWGGIQTLDGGYAILSGTYGGETNFIKTDQYGNIVLERNYRSGTTEDLIQTSDSGFIFVGNGIHKINKNGDSLWYKVYGNSFSVQFKTIKKYYDNGFIICGYHTPGGLYSKAIVIRINESGDLIWEINIIDSNYSDSYAKDLLFDSNNNIAVTGYFNNNSWIPDLLFIKISPQGQLYLKKIFHNPNYSLSGRCILHSYDNNYIISGGAGDTNYSISSHFTKVDTSGFVITQKFYSTYFPLITYTNDSNYAMSGGNIPIGSNLFTFGIRKIDQSGNIIWLRALNNAYSISNAEDFKLTNDHGFLLVGYYFDTIASNPNALYVAKTDSEGWANPIGIQSISNEIPQSFLLHQNYPNPFNPSTKISFKIPLSPLYPEYSGGVGGFIKLVRFDILGREVEILIDKNLKPGKYSIDWSPKNIPSGIYFCSMYVNEKIVQSIKLIMVK